MYTDSQRHALPSVHSQVLAAVEGRRLVDRYLVDHPIGAPVRPVAVVKAAGEMALGAPGAMVDGGTLEQAETRGY